MEKNGSDKSRASGGERDVFKVIGDSRWTLQNSELLYRSLFEAAPDAVIILEGERIVDCNRRCCDMFGGTHEQLVGLTPHELSPAVQPSGELSKDGAQRKINALLNGESQYFEWKHKRLDTDSVFDAEVSLDSLDFLGAKLLLAIVRDVTDRKNAENARMIAEAELEKQRLISMRADRLRSLGEMATGMAHELNQPLSGVRVFAESLLIGMDRDWTYSPEEIRGTMNKIVAQVERMTHLIEHVRTFAKDTGKPEKQLVHLSAVVKVACGLFLEKLKHRDITLHLELDDELPKIMVNPFTIEEVLINLISNARDAVVENNPEEKQEIRVRTSQAKDALGAKRISIEVVDHGIGMSPEVLDRALDPFFTTKAPDRGTGMGLPVSKSLIENAGGTMEIESKPKNGTKVTVWLPCLTEKGNS